MSGPDDLNPLMKFNPSGTDPTSQFIKGEMPGTDPLSQVALNPQPLPPGPSGKGSVNAGPAQKGGKDPGPTQKGGKDPGPVGRGMRNTIIVVCLIGLLFIGGTFTVESFMSSNRGVAPSNKLALLQPGVILRKQQVVISPSNGGGNAVHDQSDSVSCNTAPTDGLVEHLIGGGVADEDSLTVRSSYPTGDSWSALFEPITTSHNEIVTAVCLREAPSFFTPSHTIDVVTSAQDQISNVNNAPTARTVIAACPSGERILGGGFLSELLGGSGDYAIDASYPVSSGGADSWNVIYTLNASATQNVMLQAYAICSATLLTHLENTALPWSNSLAVRAHASCTSGTLLTGGYAFSFHTGSTPIPFISDDSPVDASTHSPLNGDPVQDWFVSAALPLQGNYPDGALWMVCWDQATSATPTATTGSQPTATGATQPTNTPKPRATATATPKPRPTNTPAPACKVLLNGSGAMTVDNTDLNVEVAAGIGHNPSVAQVQFSPASGLLSALNGAKFSDKGAGGSGLYNSLTCAQLESASYGVTSVPGSNNEVFLVKTAAGHLAKVMVTVTPGDPFPSFTWTTYKP